MIQIRSETLQDIAAIHAVNAASFPQEDEANLVDELRKQGALTVSLVAEREGQIVGHIAFSPMTIEGADSHLKAVGLAPVAVLPEYQRQGIGIKLVTVGIDACRDLGFDLMFLLGHTEYYPRFGFVPAVPLGYQSIYTPGEGDHPYFMVLPLQQEIKMQGGSVYYHPAFESLG